MTIAHTILRDRYPRLVPERFGFECEDGWIQILEDFFAVVDRELPAEATFHLRQIKEKLGSLRIYFDLEGDIPAESETAIRDACDRAEARSHYICEQCGQRGRLSSRRGYITTVCAFHADIGDTKAVPVDDHPVMIGSKDGWQRYDFDLDAFVETEKPKDW